jgi:predicted DNA binding CopG/RHH family protein
LPISPFSERRKRNLKNVTIKLDPLQIAAIKKLSTMKSIPYQTLIRHWLAEGIKHELDSVVKQINLLLYRVIP